MSSSTHGPAHVIVYGFDNLEELVTDARVILIEPRKHILNLLSKNTLQLPPGTTVIPRGLSDTNDLKEVTMYTVGNTYFLHSPPPTTNSTPVKPQREKVFVTSLRNIIRSHSIQHIQELVINLHTDNVASVLDNAELYNNIIKKVRLPNNLRHDSKLLSAHFAKYLHAHGHVTYVHASTGTFAHPPRVAMYLTEPVPDSCKTEFHQLVAQYGIQVIDCGNLAKTPVYEFLQAVATTVQPYLADLDFLIQFNPKYFAKQDAFPMPLERLKEDVLLIQQDYDIIYGSKNSMYALFDVIQSAYFAEYLAEKEASKKALFKLFRKRYFYEYISSIFFVSSLT